MNQEIKFCSTADGTGIAYSAVGTGPPFVKAANWLNHLELDWTSPVWNHWLSEFGRGQRLIRYDERGTGLSDRKVVDLSLDAFVDDLRSVVEATGIERFPLLGISQGGPVAAAYAARYPASVSHLILYGSFAAGWKRAGLRQAELEKREAQLSLIKQGWDSTNPAIRQLFTTTCLPDGNREEHASFNELQRESVSALGAARIFEAIGELDVTEQLSELDLPVLVMHAKNDELVPFDEGRRLASMIPNAKFVPLESSNHILLRHEPAWRTFVAEVNSFLGREDPENEHYATARCPKCDRLYEGDMYYCLDDGEKLIGMSGPSNEQLTKVF